MSEDVIRCSKCGGTVTEETCTACGATGQAIKCEHCGAYCPADARWCPACGRHLPAPAAEGSAQSDTMVSGGGSITRLVLLFGVMVVACFLLWKITQPAPAIAVVVLGVLAMLPTGDAETRLGRMSPFIMGGLIAAGMIQIAVPVSHPSTRSMAHRTPAASHGYPELSAPDDESFAPGVVLARFTDNGADRNRVQADFRLAGLESRSVAEDVDRDTHDVTIRFDPSISVRAVVSALKSEPGVVFAEPDYICHALHTPNDTYFDEPYDSSKSGSVDQWFLKKIDAPAAWDALRSVKSEVRLAIIDTGIDYTHPDLKNAMARDSKGNPIGRNFIQPKKPPLDDNGHGTHCAGIAAASTDNGIGVAGVGFNSFKLVAAKVLTGGGSGQYGWICNAITWCADNGCRVESLSLGANVYSQAIQDAVNYAWSKGVIVVAAAGNSASALPGYPAGCNHVMAVSATDQLDRLARFSNYGAPIAVGAPGVDILSTTPGYPCELTTRYGYKQNYDALNGTSMACPVVSGMVTALIAYQPSLKPEEAIQRIEQTADNTAGTENGGWEMQFGNGRVNLSSAIANRKRSTTVGSFYGQVVDSRGVAVSDAVVKCGGLSVRTGVDAVFRLANLKAGEHTLEATANRKSAKIQAEIVPGADCNVTIKM